MMLSWVRHGSSVWRLFRAERGGSTAIEYAIVAAGIGAVIIATVSQVGTGVVGLFARVVLGFS